MSGSRQIALAAKVNRPDSPLRLNIPATDMTVVVAAPG
jgi:hypothetical protein